jgi:hypothetical protein
MAPAAGFSEVLDQLVDRYAAGEPAAPRRWHPGIATQPFFSFDSLNPSASLRTPLQPHPRAMAQTAPTAVRPETPRDTPRPRRVLSAAQREAFHRLVSLGASLRIDFTGEELRTQFRMLARVHHPDRHPGSSEREQAQLSASFTALRRAYDLLKTTA